MTTRTRGRRSVNGRAGGGASRRKTEWIDTLVDEQTPTAGQDQESLLADYISNELAGWTLTRTLIHLWLMPQTPAATFGIQHIDMGIGLVTQEAFAAGVLPEADTETDRPVLDWVWRERVMIAEGGIAGAILQAPVEVKADIRSRRKIGDGELFLVVDNTSKSGTAFGVQTSGLIRCLFLLP